MKGGSEAQASNRVLGQLIRDAVTSVDVSCLEAIQMIETREDVYALLALDEYIDLFIPRGSNAFVRYIQEHTRVPVLGHSEGLCHAYVQHANLARAVAVCYDAKCSILRCAMRSRQSWCIARPPRRFYPCWRQCITKRVSRCADVRRRGRFSLTFGGDSEDWDTEYLDLIVSLRVVDSLEEAIAHINQHGSGHTDTIVTEAPEAATGSWSRWTLRPSCIMPRRVLRMAFALARGGGWHQYK